MRRRSPIEVRVTIDASSDVHAKLDQIIHQLGIVQSQEATQMADLAALQASVDNVEAETSAQTTVQESAVTLLNELAGLIRANATDQEALNALADRLSSASGTGASSNEALAAAVAANTPAG